MNRLGPERRAQIVASLVEGNSIRATSRMTGAAKGTVLKLLEDVGVACAEYQDRMLRNLPCKRVQVDEIWCFANAKDANVPKEHEGDWDWGSVWTWTALCADTKIVPSWVVGGRDAFAAMAFMEDLAGRLANRIQLTSDGHGAYLMGVEHAFGSAVDYAQLVKRYQRPRGREEARYSPPKCIGADEHIVQGKPDPRHISTAYVERQNLTMRMGMRRFTRLTNAFTRKVENLEHALALHYCHYNFVRVHQALKTTPAVAAGVADHEWSIDEMIGLLLVQERRQREIVKPGAN